MSITDNQFRAVQELIDIMKEYDVQFSANDLHGDVDVYIGEDIHVLRLGADLSSLENWLEAHEHLI